MRISAVIIARNEERNIERCLKSVAFCDEIIVVDSGSTDQTCEIARRYTDRVYFQEWRGYVEQRNHAIALASHDWVLSIDADEEVIPELRAEILRSLNSNPEEAAFTIPRKTIHFGRWIRHGGWYPNRLVRLFRKSQGKWSGGQLHEFWETHGKIGQLRSDLLHYSFENLFDQVERNNRYSSLGAKGLIAAGESFAVSKLFFKPLMKFLETYVAKKGFLDGYPGFIISVSAAYSVFLKWAKLWESQNVTYE